MKKLLLSALSLTLLLSLAACGGAPAAPEADPPEADPPEEPEVQEPARPQTADLEFSQEGEPQTLAASLYTGDGFSLYIPAEGWLMETDTEDGFPSVSWESAVNDAVELEIVTLKGRDLNSALEWAAAEKDDFTLTTNEDGSLFGQDLADREFLDVRLVEGSGEGPVTYVLLAEYPMEAAEGFGIIMRAMADTFLPAE